MAPCSWWFARTPAWHVDAARGPSTPSFDHLVGTHEQRRRHVEAERPRRLEIDGRFVFGWRLYRKVGRLSAAQNAVDIRRRSPILVDHVRRVGHETAGRDKEAVRVDRRQAMARRERDDEIAMQDAGAIRQHDKASIRQARERLDGALDVGGVIYRTGHEFERERRRNVLGRADEVIVRRRYGIGHEGGAPEMWRDLFEQGQPFSGDAFFVEHEAGDIAARVRQTRNQARAERVGDVDEYDRNRAALPLQRHDHRGCMAEDYIGLQRDHLFRERLILVAPDGGKPNVDVDIAALRPSVLFERLAKCLYACLQFRIGLSAAHQYTNSPHTPVLLRAPRERPGCRRDAEQRDELAALHSITSSARASKVGGTVRPSALAVTRLTTRSNLIGCSTGRSAGFAPRRILST